MTNPINPHRIDSPSQNPAAPVSSRRPSAPVGIPATASSCRRDSAPAPSTAALPDDATHLDDFNDQGSREDWLGLHAADLIVRLQAWSKELDARQSQLNIQASQQDARERQFRLRQQDALSDLEEQRRGIERLRTEIEAQARRLAFHDN